MADIQRRNLTGLLGLGVIACAGRPAQASEPVQTRDFPVTEFSGLRLALAADYELTPSRTASLQIIAEPKILALVKLDTGGGVLSIATSGSYKTEKGIRVRIGFVRLDKLAVNAPSNLVLNGLRGTGLQLSVSSPSELVLKDLNLSTLTIDLEGSGTVKASGTSTEQRLTIKGSGSLEAQTLATERTRIAISGAGDAAVNAKRSLDVTISGAATVRYTGNPEISRRIDGVGTIERL